MFWSDLGPRVGYEAIGVIDSKLKTVAIFAKSSPAPATAIEKGTEETTTTATEEVTETPVLTTVDATKSPTAANPDAYDKGVVLYLRGERIVGILLWNVFNRINIARKVISQDIRTTDYDEVAKLFNIHEGHE